MMNGSLRFLVLGVVASGMISCTTLANRRDLFAPTKRQGEGTERWEQVSNIENPSWFHSSHRKWQKAKKEAERWAAETGESVTPAPAKVTKPAGGS